MVQFVPTFGAILEKKRGELFVEWRSETVPFRWGERDATVPL